MGGKRCVRIILLSEPWEVCRCRSFRYVSRDYCVCGIVRAGCLLRLGAVMNVERSVVLECNVGRVVEDLQYGLACVKTFG